MKFKEFVAIKEMPIATAPPLQTQVQNPANKQAVVRDLQAAMKAPVPPGVNPAQYLQKMKSAAQIARTTGAPSASAAVDTANAQAKASQMV